jgi:hypothetical protein
MKNDTMLKIKLSECPFDASGSMEGLICARLELDELTLFEEGESVPPIPDCFVLASKNIQDDKKLGRLIEQCLPSLLSLSFFISECSALPLFSCVSSNDARTCFVIEEWYHHESSGRQILQVYCACYALNDRTVN